MKSQSMANLNSNIHERVISSQTMIRNRSSAYSANLKSRLINSKSFVDNYQNESFVS
jgi:hypothetical protein